MLPYLDRLIALLICVWCTYHPTDAGYLAIGGYCVGTTLREIWDKRKD